MIPSGGIIGAAGAAPAPQWSDWLVPAANSNIDRDAGGAWTNGSNAYTENNTYATATVTASKPTDWLYLSSFQSKPTVTEILGVEVKTNGKVNLTGSSAVLRVELWNGSQIGNAARTASFAQTSDADVTVGGESDLFGASSISAATFDASDFGARISVDLATKGPTVSIDLVHLRVYYR